jgi:hypothetical protein
MNNLGQRICMTGLQDFPGWTENENKNPVNPVHPVKKEFKTKQE